MVALDCRRAQCDCLQCGLFVARWQQVEPGCLAGTAEERGGRKEGDKGKMGSMQGQARLELISTLSHVKGDLI